MSGLDGFNMEDMLNSIAPKGTPGDVERKEPLEKQEESLTKLKVKIEGDEKGDNNVKGRKGRTVTRKKSTKEKSEKGKDFNIKEYSRIFIQKDLLNFLQVLHPDWKLRDIVNSILQNYVAKNQGKIQEAMVKSLKEME